MRAVYLLFSIIFCSVGFALSENISIGETELNHEQILQRINDISMLIKKPKIKKDKKIYPALMEKLSFLLNPLENSTQTSSLIIEGFANHQFIKQENGCGNKCTQTYSCYTFTITKIVSGNTGTIIGGVETGDEFMLGCKMEIKNLLITYNHTKKDQGSVAESILDSSTYSPILLSMEQSDQYVFDLIKGKRSKLINQSPFKNYEIMTPSK